MYLKLYTLLSLETKIFQINIHTIPTSIKKVRTTSTGFQTNLLNVITYLKLSFCRSIKFLSIYRLRPQNVFTVN